jgi:hypothetical protein
MKSSHEWRCDHPVSFLHAVQTHPEEERMTDLTKVVAQLKQERDKLDQAIAALSGVGRAGRTGKRTLSAAARKRIADAQRARWAKFKAKKKAR